MFKCDGKLTLICIKFYMHAFLCQNTCYSPCVKQSAQTKINPNPYTSQVCKVMDAAQWWWSVVSAGGERARYFPCSHLIVHQNRQAEKSSRDPSSPPKNEQLDCLSPAQPQRNSQLAARSSQLTHCVWVRCQWGSSERGSQSIQAGSSAAQQPVRQRETRGRKINECRN